MKKISYFSVLCIIFVFMPHSRSTIIFLNGTSSAGKSSIMKELVDQLEGNYTPVSIDKFKLRTFRDEALEHGLIQTDSDLKSASELKNYLELLPADDKKKWEEYFRSLANTLGFRMYNHVAELASAGKNVIVDHVLTHDHDIEDCLFILNKFDVFFVLVYCPFDQLVYRVAKRNTSGKTREKRTIDSVFGHYGLIYRPGEKENCLARLSRDQVHNCLQQARSLFVDRNALYRCEKFLVEKLGLAYHQNIYITPTLTYDFVINSARAAPCICARQIVKNLLKRPNYFSAFTENLKEMLKTR